VNAASDPESARFVQVNGIQLRVVEAGPPQGPAVIHLHGFPEFSYSWRHQIPCLAAAGFRVIAPDLRGYNTSDKPVRVRDYRVEELVGDVIGLIEQTPTRRATLIGHDWGGIIAWFAAMWRPDRVENLAILNAPHPGAYFRELKHWSQLLRSWYAIFFQLPRLPEWLIRRNDYAMVRSLFRQGPARKSADPEHDIQRYIQAIAQPGALTAAINYYRAAMCGGPRSALQAVQPITLPTLLIWGDQDPYLVSSLTKGLDRWVANLRIEHLPQGGHWIQNDEPDEVNRILLDFLQPR
jgi:pimeloyl-ACP methyl ester carboxylesterase